MRRCARPISEPPVLEITNLHAGYGGSEVLAGLSLSIAAGDITALLGRNGMGKTTLLRTIMGLVKPSHGSIMFKSRDIAGIESFEIARRGIAYVPQGREIFAGLSVAQNLRLASADKDALAMAYGLFPALAEKADEPGGGLSGGQQQQLAIARALMRKPRLLLLDEPSEGIQPSVVQEIAAIVVKAARSTHMSVLLVEQNTSLALSMADRVIFMESGRTTISHATAAVSDVLLQQHMGL